jgi:hypothetical protein
MPSGLERPNLIERQKLSVTERSTGLRGGSALPQRIKLLSNASQFSLVCFARPIIITLLT